MDTNNFFSYFDNIFFIEIVIILISIFLIFLYYSTPYKNLYGNGISMKKSLIPNSGRGVFAEKDFKKDEVIEICPLITDTRKNIVKSKIEDYAFKNAFNDNEVVIAFGMCSMYNHSDNFNVVHKQDPENMIYVAKRDIKKGEELYVNYGKGYWNTRKK